MGCGFLRYPWCLRFCFGGAVLRCFLRPVNYWNRQVCKDDEAPICMSEVSQSSFV